MTFLGQMVRCVGVLVAGERHDLHPSETMSYYVNKIGRKLFVFTNLLVLTIILWLTFFFAHTASGQSATQSVTLTVAHDPAQKLEGFGCSLVNLNETQIPTSARAELFNRVFGDLHMNVLRLWVQSGPTVTSAQMKSEFYQSYVDSGIIAAVQKRGVTGLLLAPARGENPPTEAMSEYASKLAEFIQGVQAERGIKIDVTGIANEPAGFKPDQMAEAVRLLRQQLDAHHLKEVEIIAPEAASADGSALQLIAGIKSDPVAWSALRGIATHSYNMAATPDFPRTIAGTSKQYWMTEAADNGNESEVDANLAASTAARFLNDLNCGVTHWIYFIGFYDSPDVTRDEDNATKLMVYDRKQKRIFRPLKYDWLRQLRAGFPNGSRIYPVKAQPGDDLVFSYGQKPFLNAVAAKRPGGGWSLAMVNLTGVKPDTSISTWHPSTLLEVRWEVPSLAGEAAVTLNIYRSDAARRFTSDGHMVMTNGTIILDLRPSELVTLIKE